MDESRPGGGNQEESRCDGARRLGESVVSPPSQARPSVLRLWKRSRVDPSLPPYLEALEEMSLDEVEPAAQRLLLSRHTANLQLRDLFDNEGPHIDSVTSLSNLRRLHLTLFHHPDRIPHLVSLLDACGSALRELAVMFKYWDNWNLQDDKRIAELLLHAPRLANLSIAVTRDETPDESPHLGEPLLAALAASSTLQHLNLTFRPTPSLLSSLPFSLISLRTCWIPEELDDTPRPFTVPGSPPLPTWTLVETLQAIVKIKSEPLQLALEKFILTGYTGDADLDGELVVGLVRKGSS